mgnify:CR=1 FL=1
MLVVPFKAEHLEKLKLQDAQMYLSGWVSPEQGQALEAHPSYTAVDNDTPLAAAGVIPQWQGRSLAWAFLSPMGPRQFVGVHRAVKNFLDACYTQRIEMIGFKMEAERMEAYSPDGRACALYARVL